MPPFTWTGIVSNTLTGMISGALALMVLLQAIRDVKARSFARMMVVLFLISFLTVIMRFQSIFGLNIQGIFHVLVILTASITYCVAAFTLDFCVDPRKWHRWALNIYAVFGAALILFSVLEALFSLHLVFDQIFITPDGLVDYTFGPLLLFNIMLIISGEIVMLLSMWIVVQQYRKKRSRTNLYLTMGVICLALGAAIVPIPGIEQYVFEQLLYAAGSLFLISPVLKQRLLDPLEEKRRQLEAQVEETRKAREQADAASLAKTQFIATMSHEIRAPLQAIITNSGFMKLSDPKRGLSLPTEYLKEVEEIEKNADYLLKMMGDVLNIQKIEAGKFDLDIQPIDPLPILETAKRMASDSLKPGVELRAIYPKDLPCILADEIRLKQVLLNLVVNACKFTDKGSVTVDAQVIDGVLRFSVADTGMGISTEMQSKLFQPFVQASKAISSQYGGSGMGLVISKRLVELQCGDIWLESRVGEGTTFFVTIPMNKHDE